MADEKNKVGTTGEYGLRDDDRPSGTAYTRGRRRSGGAILVFLIVAILAAIVLLAGRFEVPGIGSSTSGATPSGTAVQPGGPANR